MAWKIVISVLGCLLVGFVDPFGARDALVAWYPTLKKPAFTPPSWLFAPVWTALYIMMGVAAGLVWDKGLRIPEVRAALFVFLVQLALNFLWSPVFFSMRSPVGGLVVIILLWLAVLLTTVFFLGLSRPAGLLLLPYLFWVSFAVALNAAIVDLNK